MVVKRIRRNFGYPPDEQKRVTATVIEQPEVLCQDLGGVSPPSAVPRRTTRPTRLARTFVGLLGSHDEAVSEVAGWALGWARRSRPAASVLSIRHRR